MRKVAQAMEMSADSGDFETVQIRVADLEAQFALLADAIKEMWFAEKGGQGYI